MVIPLVWLLEYWGRSNFLKVINELAQFDDIAQLHVPVGPQKPPLPYKGLAYQNVIVAEKSPVLPGLIFHSPTRGLGSAPSTSTFTLNAIYPTSKVQTFDLRKLCFGCKPSAGPQGNGNPAEGCKIQVTGYKQSRTDLTLCQIAGVGSLQSLRACASEGHNRIA